MPKFQQRDFYFGAALSMFFRYNNDARPSLIESIGETTQLIKMLTDTSEEFYIFMKYTADCRLTKKENLTSWTFALTEKDKCIIQSCISNDCPTYIFFICGISNEYKTGEIAIINQDEYSLLSHKDSITVKTKGERPKVFDIHISKSNTDIISVPRNRIEKQFQSHSYKIADIVS